jgi:PBP1b-binding outer membrane lipoprotein LpoB
MKRIIIVTALALSLAGCASLKAVSNGFSLATASVANPVTQTKEAQIELALDSAVQVLLTYKKACDAGGADVNCKDNIRQIKAYTLQIKPLVAQLRNFVDNNDQVNAVVVYNQLASLYTNLKSAATSLGVNIGSAS